MFWIAFVLFLIVSVLLTIVILIQEPKQSGLGDALGGGGGADFASLGGTAGGLHRTTIYLAIAWGVLALLLGLIPR
ncbi:MAG: preprotein translocase subunit SecG [Deinococcales bacterium]|nr:preprotein translocase subunit SecG [Deinococcales bacterium]